MVELVVSIQVLTIKFFQLRCGFENLQTYQGQEGQKGRIPRLNIHTLAQPSESPGPGNMAGIQCPCLTSR